MPNSGPPWVRQIEVTVVVDNEPVPSQPTTEAPAGDSGRYSGGDTSYQSVAKWTVTTDKVGELKEILIVSDDYDHTQIKVSIAGVDEPDDWLIQQPMPLIYEDLKLAAASEVEVQVKSTDGTSIKVDAVIVGKEIG